MVTSFRELQHWTTAYKEFSHSNTLPFHPQLEVEVCLYVAHDKFYEEVDKEHLVEECEVLHPEQLHRDHQGQARPAVTSNLAHGQKLHPKKNFIYNFSSFIF